MLTFNCYQEEDLSQMTDIWNVILEDGMAFPGECLYTPETFKKLLEAQDVVTCMYVGDQLAGYYIIHPNNIGRCSHIGNATYCMAKDFRGQKHFPHLVRQSLRDAKEAGFKGMQFNAVVASNYPAIYTYTKQGFEIIGTIRNGFRIKDDSYANMYIMYREL